MKPSFQYGDEGGEGVGMEEEMGLLPPYFLFEEDKDETWREGFGFVLEGRQDRFLVHRAYIK